jgi:hypothetical protein
LKDADALLALRNRPSRRERDVHELQEIHFEDVQEEFQSGLHLNEAMVAGAGTQSTPPFVSRFCVANGLTQYQCGC